MPNPESSPPGRCVVTGASGYLGGPIVAALVRRGWSVRACSCSGRPPTSWVPDPAVEWVRYELGGAIEPELLASVDALVHGAWDLSTHRSTDQPRCNVEGSAALLAAARHAAVGRLVFVSSLAAFEGCRSTYGAEKLSVEGAFTDASGYLVRPGLVWGGAGAGLFGRLARVISSVPLLPLPLPSDLALQLVHVDDLAEVVAELCVTEHPPGLVVAAAEAPVRLGELVRELGATSGRRPPMLLPVPFAVARGALALGERLGLPLPFRSDSLTSIAHLNPAPFVDASLSCQELGVKARDFAPVDS